MSFMIMRMEEGKDWYRVLVGKPEGKNHWGDAGVDGRIILRWIFRKWDLEYGLDMTSSGNGQAAGTVNRVINIRVT
jgi:hypothetical protein